MNMIRSLQLWYPQFTLGSTPMPVECTLSIVEVDGNRYLKTPFAFMNAYDDNDIKRQIGKGYYATSEECQEYLVYEYPWYRQTEPIMEELCDRVMRLGKTVGEGRTAAMFQVSVFGEQSIFMLARGHKAFSLKQVKDVLKNLKQAKEKV